MVGSIVSDGTVSVRVGDVPTGGESWPAAPATSQPSPATAATTTAAIPCAFPAT
jgi:hypothetical protein